MSPTAGRALRQSEREYLIQHRVGRLATIDPRGRPHALPVCFAVLDNAIVIALDDKPKSVNPNALQRVRNLEAHPDVALVVDDYADDWRQLSWVMVRGKARVMDAGDLGHVSAVRLLREKYPQYLTMSIDRRPVIRIDIDTASSWSWDAHRFPTN